MSLPPIRDQAARIRGIPLRSVLLAAAATPDRHDKARWHTPQGAISVTGMKFFNWNRAVGGGGAIDLVIHLYGLDFKGALAWLSARFPGHVPAPSQLAACKSDLKLPMPHTGTLPAVKKYLIAQRGIDSSLVARLIQSGDLYADPHANAVFLLRGRGNVPVGAELRGTGPRSWRGLAPGSRKNRGYFSIRAQRIDGIILCESAIDAISCFAIHPDHECVSTAGARPNPFWLMPLIHRSPHVYCGFDADPVGDAMAQAMITLHPSIRRLRPPDHDWNDCLRRTRR